MEKLWPKGISYEAESQAALTTREAHFQLPARQPLLLAVAAVISCSFAALALLPLALQHPPQLMPMSSQTRYARYASSAKHTIRSLPRRSCRKSSTARNAVQLGDFEQGLKNRHYNNTTESCTFEHQLVAY